MELTEWVDENRLYPNSPMTMELIPAFSEVLAGWFAGGNEALPGDEGKK